jgi:multidrug efflux pump subunit AcrA (membrane-fusion protein)
VATETARPTPVGMAVTVVRAEKVCFWKTLTVVGTLVPRNEVLVRADREGLQISHIFGQVGDRVSSNQVLARLAPPAGRPGGSVAIRAPVDGSLLSAPPVVGAMATARGEPLFRIVADDELELAAEIPANQLAQLFAGQAVMVRIAGLDELPGRIRNVSIAVDAASQLGRARISIEPNPNLRAGAFGRAVINSGQSCGLGIPLSALLYGPGGPVVQVVHDGRVQSRPVTIGLISAGQIEVREGLGESDLVVMRAGAFLREGDRVRAVTVTRR